MTLSQLSEAVDVTQFGGKAASLASALQDSLPVPGGFALSTGFVKDIIDKEALPLQRLREAFAKRRGTVAVRSSAIGEDAADASFAGQHISVLNVNSFEQLLEAINTVHASGETVAAKNYRQKMGLASADNLMAIVMQDMVDADVSGVMFTRNPISRHKEIVIESSWGVGEVVVSGAVIPDYYRLNTDGLVVEERRGTKDIVFKLCDNGGVEEIEIEGDKVEASSLAQAELSKLCSLGQRCEGHYGEDLDIEWCLSGGDVYLLQCRPITALAS